MHYEPPSNSNKRYCNSASLRPPRIDQFIKTNHTLSSQEVQVIKPIPKFSNRASPQGKRKILANTPKHLSFNSISNPSHISESVPPNSIAQDHIKTLPPPTCGDIKPYTHPFKCQTPIYSDEINSTAQSFIKTSHGSNNLISSHNRLLPPSYNELTISKAHNDFYYPIYAPHFSTHQIPLNYDTYDSIPLRNSRSIYLATQNNNNNVNKWIDENHIDESNNPQMLPTDISKVNYENIKNPENKEISPPKKKRIKISKPPPPLENQTLNLPDSSVKAEEELSTHEKGPLQVSPNNKANFVLNSKKLRKKQPQSGIPPDTPANIPNYSPTLNTEIDKNNIDKTKPRPNKPKSFKRTLIHPPNKDEKVLAVEPITHMSKIPITEDLAKKSPIKGIYYDAHKKLWRVQWRINRTPNAKRTSKSFSESDHGFWLAKAKAALWALSEEVRKNPDLDETMKTKHEIFFRDPKTTITLLEEFYQNHKHEGKKRELKNDSNSQISNKRTPLDLSLNNISTLLEEYFEKAKSSDKRLPQIMSMQSYCWAPSPSTKSYTTLHNFTPVSGVYSPLKAELKPELNSPKHPVKKN